MLDKRTVKLLKNLAHICEDGTFKVIDIPDMAKVISKKADADTIRPILKFLADDALIDIKYSDENKYCLSVLPKGRVFVETQDSNKIDVTLSRRMIAAAIAGSFFAAFAGALLANIILKFLGL